jgi:hypothetical protein
MALSRAETVGFYHLALMRDLIPIETPIKWADRRIETSENALDEDVELSMSVGHPIDYVIDILRNQQGPQVPSAVFRMFAALLNRKVDAGELTEVEAAKHLYGLHSVYPEADNTLGWEIACIDDYFDPAIMGQDEAAREVRLFLQRHQSIELPPID